MSNDTVPSWPCCTFWSSYFWNHRLWPEYNLSKAWSVGHISKMSWTVGHVSFEFIYNRSPPPPLVYLNNRVLAFKSNGLVNTMHVGARTSRCSLKGIMVGVDMTTRWLAGLKSFFWCFGGNKGRYTLRGVFKLWRDIDGYWFLLIAGYEMLAYY